MLSNILEFVWVQPPENKNKIRVSQKNQTQGKQEITWDTKSRPEILYPENKQNSVLDFLHIFRPILGGAAQESEGVKIKTKPP